MRPIPVVKPKDLAETLRYLEEGGKPIAGGTDILVAIRKGLEKPPFLVYIGELSELRVLEEKEEGIEVGAALTHLELLSHRGTERLPILRQALRTIGSPAIRATGTIGGNVVTASPAGDSLVALYLLEAQVRLVSQAGERMLPIHEFITGPRKTALKSGEIVRSIFLPYPEGEPLSFFRKVGRRRALVIAVASLGALVWSKNGRVEKARLALGSVAPTILRPREVEEALVGRPVSPEAWEDLVPVLSAATNPISDLRASAEYRRKVAGRLLLALAQTLQTMA
ncbi:MAG: xanthine dehydrogenase family protein subunit M [Candidatus Bipolaricaulota bacterium]|nr:xanthine dehydrogenase family protein subunit M [Candidatus Bipolaricaulota bacterium]MDW8126702.1 xanthine dehydrogenase family protein subunit M [Candidatus Bipolaricaulota bacterium]